MAGVQIVSIRHDPLDIVVPRNDNGEPSVSTSDEETKPGTEGA